MTKLTKIFFIAYIVIIVIIGLMNPPKDNCTHLTGIDYDRCHIADVKGR